MLSLIGLAASSWYQRNHPGYRRVENPTPHNQRRRDIALTDEEKQIIAAQLNEDPHLPVYQVFHRALDQGNAVASLRSYYRIANTTLCPTRGPVVTKPRTSSSPQTTPPTLQAHAPYQTLVWDITYLPLVERKKTVALHLVLDLYSRSVVGWVIDNEASETTARGMFERVINTATKKGYKVSTVHSDNGSTMKADSLKKLFQSHDITQSHSRPRVSDDNPHVESSFSTLKGDATYPKVFESAEHAAQWVADWVEYYNTTRYHPGLGNFTPKDILDGTWQGRWAIRNAHKQKLYEANPARYRYKPPVTPQPTLGVTFNLTNTPEDISNRTLSEAITNT